MATIRQHRPPYFTGFENATATFQTVDELLAIPWVASFRTMPSGTVDPNFIRFAWSAHGDRAALMAIYNSGLSELITPNRQQWFVVGFVDEPEVLQTLPKWTGG